VTRNFLEGWLAPSLLLCALALGGASAAGVWANALLTLIALVAAAWSLASGGLSLLSRPLRWMCGCAIALPLLQLVPLPPSLWASLPGRGAIARAFDLMGSTRPWLPLSLDPESTLGAALSLIVPLAMLLVGLRSGPAGLRRALQALALFAFVSLVLGILQIAGGEASGLYPYAFSNFGLAVGFFANRNHLATLLLCAMPAIAAVAGTGKGPRLRAMVALLLASVGVLLVRSDAGLVMLGPVLAMSLWIIPELGLMHRRGRLLIAAGAVLLVVFLAGFAMFASHNESGGAELHRPFILATTLEAARDYFPVGSGADSFEVVYPAYEDAGRISSDYTAHAHCDYAEVLLEYGLPGLLMILGVLAWLAARVRVAWREGSNYRFGRAGTAMIGVVLVHSLVDYPLRTAAIAAVAGLAAALAARPQQAPDAEPSADAMAHIRVAL
jgi:O-antigen ligase